jgi:tetratricopeptide (TPR) repeat protein
VVKDANTRGLLISYVKTLMDVAQYCDQVKDTVHGVQACQWSIQLGLNKDYRAQVMFQMSPLLANLGRPDLAQTYLDSANSMTSQSPTTRAQTARTQAAILRAQGSFAAAESIYLNIVRMVPDWYWDLYDLYLGTRDTAKAEATLDNWYRSVPQNWENTQRLVDALTGRLEDRKHALEILDSYAIRNPLDSQKVRLAKQRL